MSHFVVSCEKFRLFRSQWLNQTATAQAFSEYFKDLSVLDCPRSYARQQLDMLTLLVLVGGSFSDVSASQHFHNIFIRGLVVPNKGALTVCNIPTALRLIPLCVHLSRFFKGLWMVRIALLAEELLSNLQKLLENKKEDGVFDWFKKRNSSNAQGW